MERTSVDLNEIMFTGDIYYRKCLKKMPLEKTTNGLIDAVDLCLDLTINDQIFAITCAPHGIGDGHLVKENLQFGMIAFEKMIHNLAILTNSDKSYALIKYRDQMNTSYKYVFFDSHGRKESGKRVYPSITGLVNGKVSILYFDNNKNSWISSWT